MANKELSPVVEVPSKREMRHRRKKEQEEMEEETAVEIRDGDLADEETQRLAISLGFTKAIRYGSCRHALLEAMRDKPNGVSVEEIMKTSEKNGLARSWKKSTIPKNTIVSMMGDKTFTRIARGVYVLTCYLNDRENNRDENTKNVVAVFSLEMSKEELVQRVLFSEAKVTSGDARKGQLGPEKWQRVVDAASKVHSLPIYFDDASVVTVTDIRAKSRRLKSRRGIDLIIVDYLQLMEGSSGDNRQQEIANISRNLKNLAKELDVPIIAVSQLNRAAEAREDKRPRLGDLRESGAIEQDADIVMMLYRDDYYDPASELMGIAEVNIVKNRSGETGKINMNFQKEFTQFNDLARQQ